MFSTFLIPALLERWLTLVRWDQEKLLDKLKQNRTIISLQTGKTIRVDQLETLISLSPHRKLCAVPLSALPCPWMTMWRHRYLQHTRTHQVSQREIFLLSFSSEITMKSLSDWKYPKFSQLVAKTSQSPFLGLMVRWSQVNRNRRNKSKHLRTQLPARFLNLLFGF